VLHILLLALQILLLTVSFHLYPRKLTFSTLKTVNRGLTFREQHKLQVIENELFGCKVDE
jgi:hypothetical protein